MSFLLAIVTGCSGIRKAGRSAGKGKDVKGTVAITDLENQNLSNHNFYIQKAEVDFDSPNSGLSFIATIKYVIPDQYLISLRMKTGIEIARIYLDSDTVLANDRINRKLIHGEPSALSARYGIPLDIIPVIFGDFIGDSSDEQQQVNCENGTVSVGTYIKGVKLVYDIDCGQRKPVQVRQESYSGITSGIQYDDFIKNGDGSIPRLITLTHHESGSTVKIKVEKIEAPWNGTIEFVPGSRYEHVELK